MPTTNIRGVTVEGTTDRTLGDFELSRSGWELYHKPRYPRANYPVQQPELMKDPGPAVGFAAFAAGAREILNAAENPAAPTRQGEKTMRGLQRLAGLAGSIMDEIDKEAGAVADELVAAKAEAKETIGHFRDHAGQIRKVAADVKAQLGQISNIPPPEGSGS